MEENNQTNNAASTALDNKPVRKRSLQNYTAIFKKLYYIIIDLTETFLETKNYKYYFSIPLLLISYFTIGHNKTKLYYKIKSYDKVSIAKATHYNSKENNYFMARETGVDTLIYYVSMILFIFHISKTLMKFFSNRIAASYGHKIFLLTMISFISTHIVLLVMLTVITVLIHFYDFNLFLIRIDLSQILYLLNLLNFFLGLVTTLSGYIQLTHNINKCPEKVFNIFRKDYFIQFLLNLEKCLRSGTSESIPELCKELLPFEIESEDNSKDYKINKTYFQPKKDPIDPSILFWVHSRMGSKSKIPYYTSNKEGFLKYAKEKRIEEYVNRIAGLKDFGIYIIKDFKVVFDINKLDLTNLLENIGIELGSQLDDKNFFREFIKKNRNERKLITSSLNEVDKAIDKFIIFCYFIVVLLMACYLYTVFCGLETIAISILSTCFGAGIIFQSSVKNVVDNIIFLFCIHPYDAGDRVFVDIEDEIQNMVVSKIAIFSTIFTRLNGMMVYIPNTVLFDKLISNINRSSSMSESHRIQIDFNTPKEKIDRLKSKLKKYLKTENNGFLERFMLNFETFENTNKLHLKIFVTNIKNFQNYGDYIERKTKFLCHLNLILNECRIGYKRPIQRVMLLQ